MTGPMAMLTQSDHAWADEQIAETSYLRSKTSSGSAASQSLIRRLDAAMTGLRRV